MTSYSSSSDESSCVLLPLAKITAFIHILLFVLLLKIPVHLDRHTQGRVTLEARHTPQELELEEDSGLGLLQEDLWDTCLEVAPTPITATDPMVAGAGDLAGGLVGELEIVGILAGQEDIQQQLTLLEVGHHQALVVLVQEQHQALEEQVEDKRKQ